MAAQGCRYPGRCVAKALCASCQQAADCDAFGRRAVQRYERERLEEQEMFAQASNAARVAAQPRRTNKKRIRDHSERVPAEHREMYLDLKPKVGAQQAFHLVMDHARVVARRNAQVNR